MIAADCLYRAMRTGVWPAWCDRRLEAWLTTAELATYATLRHRGRRYEWLLGRWLAKKIVRKRILSRSMRHAVRLRDIQIVSRDDRGKPVPPRITVGDQALDWSLSISHSANSALVALSCTPGVTVGVDVTPRVPPTAGFLNSWFTARERAWTQRQDDAFAVATLWAVKEAAYKALRRDEPFAPRKLETRPRGRRHFQCAYDGRDLNFPYEICTQRRGQEVVALALFDREGHRVAPPAAAGRQGQRGAADLTTSM